MRDTPPTIVHGPTLIFDSARRNGGTFVCSRCRTNFRTSDPVKAFQLFAARAHRCASSSRSGGRRAAATAHS